MLGSSAAILSRTFHRKAQSLKDLQDNMNLPAEILKLRNIYNAFKAQDAQALAINRSNTYNRINDVVSLIHKRTIGKL